MLSKIDLLLDRVVLILRWMGFMIRRIFGRRRRLRLASGEEVRIDERKHWSALAEPFFQMIGVLLAASLLGTIISPNNGDDFFDRFVSVVTYFFFFRFLFYIWLWAVNRIVVTDQRVIEESGVLNRKVASMPLTKVTDLEYNRSLMGRLLGFGELSLESAGQKQAITSIEPIADPDTFYEKFTTLLAEVHGGAVPPPPPSPPSPPPPPRGNGDDDDGGGNGTDDGPRGPGGDGPPPSDDTDKVAGKPQDEYDTGRIPRVIV
jgi:membrane protein YdbS with pleckstrin-like domain